jgi:hypothetical protein
MSTPNKLMGGSQGGGRDETKPTDGPYFAVWHHLLVGIAGRW